MTRVNGNSSSIKPYILIIGDTNIDIAAEVEEPIEMDKMYPGQTALSLGGVGRNIALNLSKLDIPVVFFTAIGEDPYGQKAYQEAVAAGIDMSHALSIENEMTPSILKLSDKAGEKEIGVRDLNLMEYITPDYLEGKAEVIHQAAYCVVSGNLTKKTLKYLTDNYEQTRFFFDTASEEMAERHAELIGEFYAVNPNQEEAEILEKTQIEDEDDAKKAVENIYNKGVDQVILTLDEGGAIYHNGEEPVLLSSISVDPVSTIGAGDAFKAGLVYSFFQEKELKESVQFAIAASTLTLGSKQAVHPKFSVEKIEQTMKKIKQEKADQ